MALTGGPRHRLPPLTATKNSLLPVPNTFTTIFNTFNTFDLFAECVPRQGWGHSMPCPLTGDYQIRLTTERRSDPTYCPVPVPQLGNHLVRWRDPPELEGEVLQHSGVQVRHVRGDGIGDDGRRVAALELSRAVSSTQIWVTVPVTSTDSTPRSFSRSSRLVSWKAP